MDKTDTTDTTDTTSDQPEDQAEQTATLLRLLRECYDELSFAEAVYMLVADHEDQAGRKETGEHYQGFSHTVGTLRERLLLTLRAKGYFQYSDRGIPMGPEATWREEREEREEGKA